MDMHVQRGQSQDWRGLLMVCQAKGLRTEEGRVGEVEGNPQGENDRS